jgi:hypothetical protein
MCIFQQDRSGRNGEFLNRQIQDMKRELCDKCGHADTLTGGANHPPAESDVYRSFQHSDRANEFYRPGFACELL